MAVIVNNPQPTRSSDNSSMVGLIILLIVIILIIYYGLPAIRSFSGGTQVNIPEKVNVNINTNAPGNPVQSPN